MPSYNDEITLLDTTVRLAGQRILQLAREGFETFTKKDQSPVTSADLEVDRIFKTTLLGAFPDDGWLSEESPDDRTRLTKKRLWVLDPIDGTKSFIRGVPQYAISIALIEHEEPVIGIIFNPAAEEFYSAIRGRGARLNGMPVHASSTQTDKLTILVNPPALKRKRFLPLVSLANCEPMGSIAYTLALVAAGRADASLNLGTQNEWDIAAGVLLVQEAGGIAVDKRWNSIRFNKPNPSVPGIIATGKSHESALRGLLNTITAGS